MPIIVSAECESATAVEPVGDDDRIRNGCGAAGHCDSHYREEKIELPQAGAHPQSRT